MYYEREREREIFKRLPAVPLIAYLVTYFDDLCFQILTGCLHGQFWCKATIGGSLDVVFAWSVLVQSNLYSLDGQFWCRATVGGILGAFREGGGGSTFIACPCAAASVCPWKFLEQRLIRRPPPLGNPHS